MEHKDHRLAALVYADIAGFSRMMEADQAGALELLRYQRELFGGIAARRGGSLVKTMGDALLLDFKNAAEALQCALEAQDLIYARNKAAPGAPLLLRIGLHVGDICFFEDDALGEGVTIAARLRSLARPGCVCLSQDAYGLALGKVGFSARDLGALPLEGVSKEIRAYEIATPSAGLGPGPGEPLPGGAAAAAPGKGPEGSPSLLTEIRASILRDCKELGRRMTVDEAREKYGFYGAEADEVIASMAERGVLARPAPGRVEDPAGAPAGASSFGIFDGKIVVGGKVLGTTEELGKGIGSAISGIVSEIERHAREEGGGDREAMREARHAARDRARAGRHAAREALRREVGEGPTGKWDRRLMEEERWRPGSEALAPDIDSYRELLAERRAKARGGLAAHTITYGAVNAFLWYLNLRTSPGGFLWAAIVSAAWGIGLVSSYVAASRAGAKAREAEAMPDLDSSQLAIYKKLGRMEDSMAQHGASTIMVSFLLGLINFLTGPSFLWFLIPSALLLLGYISHAAAFSASRPRLRRKLLDSLGIKGGWRGLFRGAQARRAEAAGLGPYADLYREAQAARDALAAQAAAGQAGPLDEGLAPSLDRYLGQVRLLAQSANEIDRLVEAIPMADLAKDRAALAAKRDAAASPGLKEEYGRSIAEIDKQERSYQELKEQSEVVRLRLSSSVNQLKQMRLDIARLQAAPGAGAGGGLEGLRLRSEELSRYLEDLRAGYEEPEADPYAELEEAERRREAEARRLEGPGRG